jgi:putative tryptophan/tyrosine transport system substrate-binding protein
VNLAPGQNLPWIRSQARDPACAELHGTSRQQVAAIAAGNFASLLAAKAAVRRRRRPVRPGLVASLARPDGNLTGVNVFNAEVAAKRLELLRDLVPGVARIAVLVNPADAAMMETQLRDVDTAARVMGVHIQTLDTNTSAEIDAAFNGRRVQLAQLAAFHHLPATYALRDYAEVGGLMSYGSNIVDGYRQVGIYVGRVLKGAKPTDLPIVQANKFELVINMQTARMLNLVVPPSLLAIADDVIE